jgi:MFS family permease
MMAAWEQTRSHGAILAAGPDRRRGRRWAGCWLGQRDHAAVLACGIVCTGLGFGLTAFASSAWQYAACVAVWTVGEILANAVTGAVLAALAPARLRGRYNEVFGLAFSLGYLIAPVAGMRLLAHGRVALWLACAGVCAIAAAWQLALGPAIRRRERDADGGATFRSG